MARMKKILPVVLFLILAAMGYFLARHLAGGDASIEQLAPEGCDLAAQSCEGILGDGSVVQLAVQPRPIELMKPLKVEVQVEGTGWTPLRLDITGLNMEMGLNRTSLNPDGRGRWRGETILPICSQRRMHWQAALLLQGPEGAVQLLYEFHTQRP